MPQDHLVHNNARAKRLGRTNDSLSHESKSKEQDTRPRQYLAMRNTLGYGDGELSICRVDRVVKTRGNVFSFTTTPVQMPDGLLGESAPRQRTLLQYAEEGGNQTRDELHAKVVVKVAKIIKMEVQLSVDEGCCSSVGKGMHDPAPTSGMPVARECSELGTIRRCFSPVNLSNLYARVCVHIPECVYDCVCMSGVWMKCSVFEWVYG